MRANRDSQKFRLRFGSEPPPGLLEFLNSQPIRDSLPAAFQLRNEGWAIELQYFLDIYDPGNFRPDRELLAFAVTTDGHELLIDVARKGPSILQDEFGNVDSLGVSVRDLLSAERKPLT